MRRFSALVFVLCLSGFACASELSIIAIQPMGKRLPDADVAMVRDGLTQFFGLEVVVLPRVPLPKSAYFKPRKRYRADTLLDFLKAKKPKNAFRILGLTAADISTTKGKVYDWGILGLATLDGTSCVVSSFRTKKRSSGARHARERLSKVAVHEIGHTLGLDHCPSLGCLMEDAHGSVLTSDREYDLCPRCRAALKKWGYRLPDKPKIPWSKPPNTNGPTPVK